MMKKMKMKKTIDTERLAGLQNEMVGKTYKINDEEKFYVVVDVDPFKAPDGWDYSVRYMPLYDNPIKKFVRTLDNFNSKFTRV